MDAKPQTRNPSVAAERDWRWASGDREHRARPFLGWGWGWGGVQHVTSAEMPRQPAGSAGGCRIFTFRFNDDLKISLDLLGTVLHTSFPRYFHAHGHTQPCGYVRGAQCRPTHPGLNRKPSARGPAGTSPWPECHHRRGRPFPKRLDQRRLGPDKSERPGVAQ